MYTYEIKQSENKNLWYIWEIITITVRGETNKTEEIIRVHPTKAKAELDLKNYQKSSLISLF